MVSRLTPSPLADSPTPAHLRSAPSGAPSLLRSNTNRLAPSPDDVTAGRTRARRAGPLSSAHRHERANAYAPVEFRRPAANTQGPREPG